MSKLSLAGRESVSLSAMDRDQIFRDDFPTARKGWDPDAVRSHLQAVADSMPDPDSAEPLVSGEPGSLARTAAERVQEVIEAAEQAAAAIESDTRSEADSLLGSARLEADEMRTSARSESDELLASARSESDEMLSSARSESEQMRASAQADAERLVGEAREEASARVEQARSAVSGLISQADELRDRVGVLGQELAGSMPPSVGEVPGPVIVPEPTPPSIPEPTPEPIPEPTPDPVPEPLPEPDPEPPSEPDPAPEPQFFDEPEVTDESDLLEEDPVLEELDDDDDDPLAPPPVPDEPATVGVGASTDDLIAQLRGGATAADDAGPGAAMSGADLGAARLVAMNMALEGSTREEISTQLEDEFGSIDDVDGLLDEVLARAGR